MRRWNRLWDVVLGVIVSLLCAFPVSAREKVILDSDMVEGFDDGSPCWRWRNPPASS